MLGVPTGLDCNLVVCRLQVGMRKFQLSDIWGCFNVDWLIIPIFPKHYKLLQMQGTKRHYKLLQMQGKKKINTYPDANTHVDHRQGYSSVNQWFFSSRNVGWVTLKLCMLIIYKSGSKHPK